jgi:galactose mutarotase-like enzyme
VTIARVGPVLSVLERKKREEGGCAAPATSRLYASAQESMATMMHFPLPREYVLTRGNTTIGVIPALSLVSHFQVGSWQVLYRPMETSNIERWGIPLMIPNFSRLKDGIFKEKGTTLPIHGFGRSLPWTVIEQDSSQISMQLTSNSATRLNYPFDFTFTATIVASEEMLTYTLTMENRSDEVMPLAPGFHPYFAVRQQDKAKLVVDGLPGFEAAAFDWETNPPDNPNPFPHHVTIQFPDRGTLTIAERPSDAQYLLANLQVWTEPVSAPDHEFVCFEPTVSSEDALNRPADRLNMAPHSSQQIVLQLTATPL